ncbi:MAG TPA: tetratricopeptide repeat protein [Candidatus Acidoferrum sp.]|nr:tetratricopeptide repeat protein [Candidatus Acidoferrum sp.]
MPAARNLERPWVVCAFLVLATLAAYLPALCCGFLTFDDDYYVTRNPQVTAGVTLAGVRWAFTHVHASNWHPLTWISHMLDCQLYGLRPVGHHLTSVLLHAANSVLLFLWLRSVTGTFWRSALVAALFALHPLHVESVAWVAERKDVLCTLFGLLSLWAYGRYAEGRRAKVERRNAKDPKGERREHPTSNIQHPTSNDQAYAPRSTLHVLGFYTLALLFFALGLMSKPMLVTLPFVLLLLDYWPLGRFASLESKVPSLKSTHHAPRNTHHATRFSFKPLTSRLLEKLPFFILSAASCLATLGAQKVGRALVPLEVLPFRARLCNALDSYVGYLRHLFWPAGLAPIYTSTGTTGAAILIAIVLLAAVTLLVLWQRKRRPYLLVGWAWYLGMLVPVIGLVQVGSQSMADRYTYLPAIGVFIMVAWGLAEAAVGAGAQGDTAAGAPAVPGSPRAVALSSCVALAALSACALVTASQLRYWQNSESVFRRALSINGDNFIAWSGLGYCLAEQGEERQAEACYERAVQIRPSFAEAWNGLGYAQANLGHYAEAVNSYETAIRLAPDHLTARNNLATALAACGRAEEAKAQCRAASGIDPYAAEPHINLAALYATEGQWDQAVSEYSRALELDPGLLDAACGLAGALAKQGKPDEAVRELSDLLASHPSCAAARLQLGIILARQQKTDDAIAQFDTLLRANPDDPAAHYQLALTLGARGESKQALAHYRAALKARPNFPEALNNLAWLRATDPDPELRDGTEATALALRACRLTDYKEAYMLGTLGAAYAEAGRFSQALESAEKAAALADQEGDAETAAINRKLAALYRAGQPYRETRTR